MDVGFAIVIVIFVVAVIVQEVLNFGTKDEKCGAVDEKCGAQWMTGFGRKLFTALPRWNSSTSLIERLFQIYGGIDVILVELWVRGTLFHFLRPKCFIL